MDPKLIEAAVAAAVSALAKAAVEPALSAGRQVWEWVKTHVTGPEAAATIAVIEAAPDKPSAPDKLSALLKDLLHDNPAAADELRRLLANAGAAPTLVQTVTGDGNKVAQVVGSGVVNIS